MADFRDTKVVEEGEVVSTEAPDQQENAGQSIADAIRRHKGGMEAIRPVERPATPREAPKETTTATSPYRLKSAYKKKKLYEKPVPLVQQPKKKETLTELFAALVKKKIGKGIL